MSSLFQDLRFGLRALRRSPGFTAVSVLTLGLGIALITTVFSLVNAFFLRPLPFPEPERLIHVWQTDGTLGFEQLRMSAANWHDLRQQARSVEDLGGYYYTTFVVGSEGATDTVKATLMTPNLLPILGREPVVGRALVDADAVDGADAVVMISDRFWHRHFAGSRDVLGREVLLDQRPHTVVGVMPPDFVFPFNDMDLWLPLVADPDEALRGENGPLLVVGRLVAGESLASARSEMATVMERLESSHPESNKKKGVNPVPLRTQLLFTWDIFALVFPALLAAIAFVILIVCANIGNLLLARSADRGHEIAFRLTLGASRGRLVRQLLTESLLLGTLGAALGAGLAWLLTRLLEQALPLDLYRVGRIEVDAVALGFALVVGVGSALAFGLAPALQTTRVNLSQAVKEGSRGASASRERGRLRAALVVAQIALAVLLVTGAGLMARTFVALQAVDLGFEPERLLTLEVTLPTTTYADDAAENRYFEAAVERVRSLPGVQGAATVYPLPLNFESMGATFRIEGRETASPDEKLWASTFWADTDYFRTMGIPLLRGRPFESADDAASEPVVAVNRHLAERFWPQGAAVGERIEIEGEWRRIVGVVGDSVAFSLDEESPSLVYYPQQQSSTRRRFFMVRSAGDPLALAPSVEAAIHEVDPAQPIETVRSMETVVSTSLGPWMMGIGGLSVLGLGALFLAAMGLYGVISYSVRQRTQELGIRSALGAERGDLMKLVLAQGLRLAAIGVVLGLAGALALSRFLRSLLFGVETLDPVTFLLAPVVLLLVATLACLWPARRAVRIDPMEALRQE